MKKLNELDSKTKISIISLAAIVIIGLVVCFLTSNNKPLFIKVPANIEAKKNGKVIIMGQTLPDTSVKIGYGIIGDKQKSDKNGNFKLKYELTTNSKETLKITAENDSTKKSVTTVVFPSKSDVNSEKESSTKHKTSNKKDKTPGISTSKYTTAYVVKFKDYDIIYLINEHTKIIAYTTSDDHSISTTTYTGDFNKGIDFNLDGLSMHAHYKYMNQASTLIISDNKGNENKAYQRDPEQVIQYYDLSK